MKTKNLTPFPGAAFASLFRAPKGHAMALAVRGTFVFSPNHMDGDRLVAALGKPSPAGEEAIGRTLLAQGPMSGETFAEDDDDRALECLYPGDFADWKPRAEVLLRGTCYPAHRRSVRECVVRFRVGAFEKSLRVLGRRAWTDDLAGVSEPALFSEMPIGYARAFGGPGYAANPCGVGASGGELPNVEHVDRPIRRRGDDPGPAGFGPINAAWPQRARKLGTQYGHVWREERWPRHAEDFDPTYYLSAPPDQWLEGYLRGDEVIVFENLHPSGRTLEGRLPGLRLRAFVRGGKRGFRPVTMHLDTLYADMDASKVYLTWRGVDAVETDDLHDVETVLFASERLDDERLPDSHYEALMVEFEADPLEVRARVPADALEKRDEMRQRQDQREQGLLAPSPSPPDPTTGALDTLLCGAPIAFSGAAELRDGLAKSLAAMNDAQPKPPPAPPPNGNPSPPVPNLRAETDAAGQRARNAQSSPPRRPATPLHTEGPPPSWATAAVADTLEHAAGQRAALAELKLPKEAEEHRQKALSALDEEVAKLRADPFFSKILSRPPFVEPAPYADLRGQDYEGRDWSGRDLSGANLQYANLSRASLRDAKLVGANLRGAILVETDATGADFGGVELGLANCTALTATGASLRETRLDRTFFQQASLRRASLQGARGKYTFFPEADLTEARCEGAIFEDAFLQKVDCSAAKFDGAALLRCHFLAAKAVRASFAKAVVTRSSFGLADLTEASFAEASGERCSFLRATLDGADLGRSTFDHAFFVEASARRTDFRRSLLRWARFYRACTTDADFSEASLYAADLCKCEMHRARFVGANLFDAKLLQAAGIDCDFTSADVRRVLRDGAR